MSTRENIRLIARTPFRHCYSNLKNNFKVDNGDVTCKEYTG